MHGHTIYCRNLKSCYFISALVIFALVTIYATNAFAWGWSRSPGQSSSTPAPSNNTGSDPSNDSPSDESANSEPTNQSLEYNNAATAMFPSFPSLRERNLITLYGDTKVSGDFTNKDKSPVPV